MQKGFIKRFVISFLIISFAVSLFFVYWFYIGLSPTELEKVFYAFPTRCGKQSNWENKPVVLRGYLSKLDSLENASFVISNGPYFSNSETISFGEASLEEKEQVYNKLKAEIDPKKRQKIRIRGTVNTSCLNVMGPSYLGYRLKINSLSDIKI